MTEPQKSISVQFGELPVVKKVTIASGRTLTIKTKGNGFLVEVPIQHIRHFGLLQEIYSETNGSTTKIYIPDGHVASKEVFDTLLHYNLYGTWPLIMDTARLHDLLVAADYLDVQKAIGDLSDIIAHLQDEH